jgi:hypothetical protein
MKKEIDIFNDPRCGHDGQPIYEAFDSEEEYNEALVKYEEQFWAEWEEMNKFRELCRTNPEAARATAEIRNRGSIHRACQVYCRIKRVFDKRAVRSS